MRRLSSRMVVYLLLAGFLFAGQGWEQPYSRLVSELPDPLKRPSVLPLGEAMRRAGGPAA